MKRNLKIKRILVALWMNGTAGRDILSGIFDYASAGRHWRIDLLQLPSDTAKELRDRIRANGLDGVITSESAQPSVKEILDETAAPLVSVRPRQLGVAEPGRRESSVGCNDFQIGECAARYFLRLGRFRSYGYIGAPGGIAWSDAREQGFVSFLVSHQEPCRVLKADGGGIYLDRAATANFIRGLPKPAAVATAYDGYGVQLLDTCRETGIPVPEDVSVIGVDNDELLCDFSEPPLTSISPDHRRVGYLAARELDALMRHPARKPQHIECPLKGIVERSSVRAPTPSVDLIRRALTFIRQHAAEGLTITDVAQHLGVSRRLLDLRFREAEKRTLLDALTERRMEVALRLLKDGSLPVAVVAARSGYRQAKSFLAAFKRRYGQTPSEWRAALAQGDRAGRK